MDYVKETLERQNALWKALLLGGGSDAPAEEDAAPQRMTASGGGEEETIPAPARPGAAEVPEKAAETAAMAPTERAAAAQRESGETAVEQALLRRSRERLLTETRLAGTFQAAEETESIGGSAPRRGEAVAAEAAQWQTEGVLRQGYSDLETADARAISRCFERDARRYDGGFIFY